MPVKNIRPGGITKKRKINVMLNYVPISEKYKDFHRAYHWDNIPTRAVKGGVGTGKSTMAIFDVLRALLVNPKYFGKKAIICGATAHHAREHLLGETLKILSWQDAKGRQRGLLEGRDYIVTRYPLPKIVFGNGSVIYYFSEESREAIKSFNVSIILMDDAGSGVTDERTWDLLFDRAFREGVDEQGNGLGFAICCLNPLSLYHWAYLRWWKPEAEGTLDASKVRLFTYTMYDNPYIKHKWAIAEDQYRGNQTAFKQRVLGEFCSPEGLVYNLQESESVLPPDKFYEAIQKGRIITAHDFGGRDATTAVFISQYQNKFWVFKEYFSDDPKRTISEHCDYLKRQPEHISARYSDTATEVITTYRQFGIDLTPADKGHGSVLAGVAIIQDLLADGRLVISSACKHLIKEFHSYEWEPKRDKPKDGNDHVCFVPGTLVTTSFGDVPIEDIVEGDLILTRHGYRKCMASGLTNRSALRYGLKLVDGTIIEGTAHHPIFTADGRKINLIDLTPEDYVLCLDSPHTNSPAKHLMGETTFYIQANDTTLGTPRPCTETCGRTITGQYPKDGTSTIKITIPTTTTSLTLNASLLPITAKSTAKSNPRELQLLNTESTSTEFVPSRSNGTPRPKVVNGTSSTALQRSLKGSQNSTPVRSVLPNSNRLNIATLDFAATDVNHSSVATRTLTMLNESVSGVVNPSRSINMKEPQLVPVRVESVRPLPGSGPVYNLTVDEHHEFFANGILVANCDALRYGIFSLVGKNTRVYSFSSTDPKNQPTNEPGSHTVLATNVFAQHQLTAQEMGAVLVGYEKDGKPLYAFAPGVKHVQEKENQVPVC